MGCNGADEQRGLAMVANMRPPAEPGRSSNQVLLLPELVKCIMSDELNGNDESLDPTEAYDGSEATEDASLNVTDDDGHDLGNAVTNDWHKPKEFRKPYVRDPSKRIYLNSNKIPYLVPRYVAWLDVMGSRSTMQRSLHASINNVGRLHVAILMHRKQPGLTVSPFMDGAYIRTRGKPSMLDFLHFTFEELAHDFVTQEWHEQRFLSRCGLSFGNVLEGTEIPTSVNFIIGAKSNTDYRTGVIFGYPMVEAFQSEATAPPFGIAIHASARSFAKENSKPLSGFWWKWFKYRDVVPEYFDEFKSTLIDYFKWCERRTHTLMYAKDRVFAHRAMAEEYFELS